MNCFDKKKCGSFYLSLDKSIFFLPCLSHSAIAIFPGFFFKNLTTTNLPFYIEKTIVKIQ